MKNSVLLLCIQLSKKIIKLCIVKYTIKQEFSMQKNYVYVVTSSQEDFFAEMAAVSMKTLRLTNINSHIIVVCDKQTIHVESPGVKLIKELSNEIIAVKAPYDSSLVRSRYLKANLIKIIAKSFVYLDSDTLILKSLDSIWDNTVDIAATVDLTPKDTKNNTYSLAMQEAYQTMGWQFPPKRYLNSGVILINDTQNVRELGNALATNWAEQYQKTGKVNDQYVFNHLINSMDLHVKLLPVFYNAQFIMEPLVAKNAAIVHVYSGQFDTRNDTVLHILSKQLKRDGKIDDATLIQMIKTKNPWTAMDSVKKYIALNDYVGAVAFMLKRLTKKIFR